MKKFLAFLLIALMSVSVYAVEDRYGPGSLNTSGAGSDDQLTGINDLSYDEAEGTYCIYVVCELTLTPTTNQGIDLGYINPDGSRMLPNENMSWRVQGANGWYFEATVDNDIYPSSGPSGADLENVYFVLPYWTYKMMGEAPVNVGSTGVNDMYHIGQLQLSGSVTRTDCQGCGPASECTGIGDFVFHPVQVVANELAIEGMYEWELYLNVDYLTWVVPVNPDGTAYTTPAP